MKIFNKYTRYISTGSITRNYSCTGVNNNLQLKKAELLELD